MRRLVCGRRRRHREHDPRPYLLEKARGGYRMGDSQIIDAMIRDGLWDIYNNKHMGMCGDACAIKAQVSRQEQDDFAVASNKRALAAIRNGCFKNEIAAVEAPAGKATVQVAEDEQPKRFNEEKLRALKPAFGKEGTVTAGNALSISDGAAAVIALSAEKARSLGIKAQVRILGYATSSRDPEWFTLAPIGAIRKLMDQLSLKVKDVDLTAASTCISSTGACPSTPTAISALLIAGGIRKREPNAAYPFSPAL